MEKDSAISFLDVLITRKDDTINTSVYRKQTFTGLGTNYNSFIPNLFKINAIRTLVHRCYNVSSTWKIFDDEVSFLKNFFQNNSYPLKLVESCVAKFLDGIFNPPCEDRNNANIHYIKLPYYGHLSFVIRKRLSLLFKKHYPDNSFRFIFTNNFTIKSYFPYKDKIPFGLIPNIVYEYTCSLCKQRYIGETSRNLTLRIAEHKGISARSGINITRPSPSPIRSHCLQHNHTLLDNDFKIIKKASFSGETKIYESLFIHQTRPELNNQTTSYPLAIFQRLDTTLTSTIQTTTVSN